MCRGMWSKLRYLYTRRHRQRLESISCEESAIGDHSNQEEHDNQDFSTLQNEEYSSLHDLHIITQKYKEKFGSSDVTHINNNETRSTTTSLGCHDNHDTRILSETKS